MLDHFKKGVLKSMKPQIDKWTTLELGLAALFKQNFKDYRDFMAISNLKMYKPSEDAFIFAQKVGNLPEICEVYWKGEYLCDVSLVDSPSIALQRINDSLIDFVKLNKKGII